MPRALPIAVAAALAMGAAIVDAQQESQRTFRGGTEFVSVFATVVEPEARLVTGLGRERFTIKDNGRVQALSVFDAAARPIHLIVLLDTSGSMTGNLTVLRSAAVQLFTRLLPGDRARVGHFGEAIRFSPSFTADLDDLIRALWIDAVTPGGPTPLWRAISAAMIELAPIDARRVVVVLTDGKDNRSRMYAGYKLGPTLDDVIGQARREDVMVYAIGMHSLDVSAGPRRGPIDPERSGPDPGLKTLAAETGGGYYELAGSDNLSDVFAAVADELHHQYLLGYRIPDTDGKLHRVEVTVTDRELTVRAKQSYQAPER